MNWSWKNRWIINLNLQNETNRAMITASNIWENVWIVNIICNRFWDEEIVKPPSYAYAKEITPRKKHKMKWLQNRITVHHVYLNNTMDMQLSTHRKSWNKERSGTRSSMFTTTKTMCTFVCLSSPMPVAPIGIANNSRVLPPKSVNKTLI